MSEQPPLTGDRTFRNDVIRLADLIVNTSLLDGYEFSNCRIIGPAILGILDNVSMLHCTWIAPGLDAVLWVVPPERGPVIGIVGVQNCTFSRCTFENIGIAGPPDIREKMEAGFRTP
jgi:hypothetical protein